LGEEPGAGEAEISLNGLFGDAQDMRGLGVGEAGEEFEAEKFGLAWVVLLEAGEQFIETDNVLAGGLEGDVGGFEIEACATAAAFLGKARAGVIYQYISHGDRGGTVEVGGTFPAGVALGGQPHEGFVDESGGLEGLAGRLGCKALGGESAELVIDLWQQRTAWEVARDMLLERRGEVASGVWRRVELGGIWHLSRYRIPRLARVQ
jgi:hypothetical protein